jgi:hypothetical protein
MFIGHYGVALAAKKAEPRISLGTLFLASQILDLSFGLFNLLGIEHVRIDPGNTVVVPLDLYDYPFTHSLLASVIWSVAFGLVYYLVRRRVNGAMIIGSVVFSHWILDFITHRPDLPLAFGAGPYFGLGLWNSLVGTLVVELGIYLVGLVLYVRTTVAKDRIGSYGFWALIVFLLFMYYVDLTTPPPTDASVMGIVGVIAVLFVLWAYWVDRHRIPRTTG